MYRILLLAFLLLACSPQRRFTRLIEKHPDLIQTDTITRLDTVNIFVPKISHDTSFLESHLYDTITIVKDRLKIKMWRDYDTIRVQGECDSITVTEIREVKIPVHYYEKKKFNWWLLLLIPIVLLILREIKRKRDERF